jgi:hypothetical protein
MAENLPNDERQNELALVSTSEEAYHPTAALYDYDRSAWSADEVDLEERSFPLKSKYILQLTAFLIPGKGGEDCLGPKRDLVAQGLALRKQPPNSCSREAGTYTLFHK